jgi:hypothetical protein
MLHDEIESYFESKEKTEELLAQYESLFLDITAIEDKQRNAEITTPGEIEKYLDIITVLENKCYAVYVVADTYKTGEESRLKHLEIKKSVADKVKVNVSGPSVVLSRDTENIFSELFEDNIKLPVSDSPPRSV